MWVLLRHLLATPKNADTKNPTCNKLKQTILNHFNWDETSPGDSQVDQPQITYTWLN